MADWMAGILLAAVAAAIDVPLVLVLAMALFRDMPGLTRWSRALLDATAPAVLVIVSGGAAVLARSHGAPTVQIVIAAAVAAALTGSALWVGLVFWTMWSWSTHPIKL